MDSKDFPLYSRFTKLFAELNNVMAKGMGSTIQNTMKAIMDHLGTMVEKMGQVYSIEIHKENCAETLTKIAFLEKLFLENLNLEGMSISVRDAIAEEINFIKKRLRVLSQYLQEERIVA